MGCKERVARALMLAQELSILADPRASCDHYACAVLDRVALETAAELRRVAARAGLNLAGQQLVHPQAPHGAANEQNAKEGSDEASSIPTK